MDRIVCMYILFRSVRAKCQARAVDQDWATVSSPMSWNRMLPLGSLRADTDATRGRRVSIPVLMVSRNEGARAASLGTGTTVAIATPDTADVGGLTKTHSYRIGRTERFKALLQHNYAALGGPQR